MLSSRDRHLVIHNTIKSIKNNAILLFMNPEDYSPEQKKDITERVEKAKKLLEELQLQPGCIVQAINTGNDVFGFQPIAYLQDTKYTSPLKL